MNKNRRLGFLPETDSLKLMLVVIAHWLIVFANFSAFFILAYEGLTPSQNPPWYIGMPLCTFIAVITFSRVIDCPITRLENKIRKRLGKNTIGGFVKHYLIKPYARAKRKIKKG
ncbi:hypothetical protein CMO96_01860 [Candidatus Woesebacteria bacterium]|nr:hypothetical protein [Candidatus Woesebacteria bacterium]|tara:strand:+ start:258 stop:599 length:342 start_codon:yes stop_codon:yes gene_type:complete